MVCPQFLVVLPSPTLRSRREWWGAAAPFDGDNDTAGVPSVRKSRVPRTTLIRSFRDHEMPVVDGRNFNPIDLNPWRRWFRSIVHAKPAPLL